ncbi:hypothetical protein C8J56DRAFT_558290 [Mycena floridula]|nr:hypothetical protein C8J56DRAFT_558290 [Mycena floridula]
MAIFRHALSRRETVLIVLGVFVTYLWIAVYSESDSIIINNHLHEPAIHTFSPLRTTTETVFATKTVTVEPPVATPIELAGSLPHTSIVHHAPGWTLFRNLYMSNGTLFILTNDNQSFPQVRMMISPGIEAQNTPENIAAREPTSREMDFIASSDAEARWGPDSSGRNRVRSLEGNTLLVNEPKQFLRHYYHLPSAFSSYQLSQPSAPPLDRLIFANSNADGWRDDPGFNSYFMRAAFPSLTIEIQEDWDDRIRATSLGNRAWHFPLVLLTDRSASHRGEICGSKTQRIAAEAWSFMKSQRLLAGEKVGGWWEPVRAAVLRYAGAPAASDMAIYSQSEGRLPMPEKIVITYISRQGGRRRLTDQAHDSLVTALEELSKRKGWELNVLQAERLSKDEQLRYISRTTILLGVHGNGLTHLVFMPPTRVSAVVEIFYPGGFAHDYQWTTTALGMTHFAVWNDTYYSGPTKPNVDYPEGFQLNYIPVHGPAVAKLVEDRIAGVV